MELRQYNYRDQLLIGDRLIKVSNWSVNKNIFLQQTSKNILKISRLIVTNIGLFNGFFSQQPYLEALSHFSLFYLSGETFRINKAEKRLLFKL